VSLGSLDPEDRLVRWINEILYLAGSGFVPASAEVTLPDDRKLEARVRGQPGATGLVRTEIKAATYHDLAITRGPGRVAGRVVLDV
jgi:SHS2 domain-containing protein